MWVGRATVFQVGLAVILAMVLGLASAALSATGGNFILGQSNSADKQTTLVGQIVDTTKSALVLKNPNGGSALQLQVERNAVPMKVNAAAGKATNLDADELDGQNSSEFVPITTYRKTESFPTNPTSTTGPAGASCDAGDVLLSGGVKLNDPTDQKIVESRPPDPVPVGAEQTWAGTVRDDNTTTGAGFDVTALCADLGEPHTE